MVSARVGRVDPWHEFLAFAFLPGEGFKGRLGCNPLLFCHFFADTKGRAKSSSFAPALLLEKAFFEKRALLEVKVVREGVVQSSAYAGLVGIIGALKEGGRAGEDWRAVEDDGSREHCGRACVRAACQSRPDPPCRSASYRPRFSTNCPPKFASSPCHGRAITEQISSPQKNSRLSRRSTSSPRPGSRALSFPRAEFTPCSISGCSTSCSA